LYQLGRTTTYSILGLILGLAGQRIYVAGYQQLFSMSIGTLIIIGALLEILASTTIRIPLLHQFYSIVTRAIGNNLRNLKSLGGYYAMGMGNGLLPCGLVFIALTTTLSFSEAQSAVFFMLAFGLGTMPSMLMTGLAGQLIKPQIKLAFQKIIPFIFLLMGILLVLRGLDLGIPFISPKLPVNPGDPALCHPTK
jgi:sulfite exporter TauE/SafE